MKHITMIKMQGCPYCANALRAMEELRGEAKYKDVTVEQIDENLETEKAKPFAKDYYYVPSFFVEGKKLYEAQPGQDYDAIYASVKNVFDEALEA